MLLYRTCVNRRDYKQSTTLLHARCYFWTLLFLKKKIIFNPRRRQHSSHVSCWILWVLAVLFIFRLESIFRIKIFVYWSAGRMKWDTYEALRRANESVTVVCGRIGGFQTTQLDTLTQKQVGEGGQVMHFLWDSFVENFPPCQ